MPELPDICLYLKALESRVVGRRLERIEVKDLFVLRSVVSDFAPFCTTVQGLSRCGKRLVLHLEQERFLVIHLMIAGRLRWRTAASRKVANSLLVLQFPEGVLHLTEAATRRRAKLFLVEGQSALAEHDQGGLDVLRASSAAFSQRLLANNHTLKRALTDPRLFDGIGNAYSDEILHRARLSPVRLTSRLTPEEVERLYQACRATLIWWIDHLQAETGSAWPEKVTAFRPEMAVHGKYGEPCPDCGQPVQRIRYADNETNYCARCQNADRLLADRSLSRLLRQDWPRNLGDLDEHMQTRRTGA